MADKDGTPASEAENVTADANREEARREIERGLRFAHVMLHINQTQGREAIASIQALIEVMVRKGLIEQDELKETIEQSREQIDQMRVPRVRMAQLGDKYAEGVSVEIDCAARIHLCHARCCTFKFYLSKQDLDEGKVRWDYGNPYWIKQGQDGYCVHCDPTTRSCMVHANRPHVCRTYDCRNDKRVWIDFEKRIPAPMPEKLGDWRVASTEMTLLSTLRDDDAKEEREEHITQAGD